MNDQPDQPNQELLLQVQRYRNLVLQYEALDHQIDDLIMQHGGTSDKMDTFEHASYKKMARERDNLLNEMRLLEHVLDIDEDDSSVTSIGSDNEAPSTSPSE